MRRSHRVLFTFVVCAGCGKGASLGERSRAVSPAPAVAPAEVGVSELALLPVIARSGRPSEPVRILEPLEGAEVDATLASSLSARVQGPKVPLFLSLDGARPRVVVSGTHGIAGLVDANVPLAVGAHDLVLAAAGPDDTALEPNAGGVASVRFFVGRRPAAPPPPRVVCLSPFGTFYGNAPSILLDFVVAAGEPLDLEVAIEGTGGLTRRARTVGRGPFALGDFASGDYRVTLVPVPGAPPALPGRCVFAYNRELERSP